MSVFTSSVLSANSSLFMSLVIIYFTDKDESFVTMFLLIKRQTPVKL